MCLFLDKEDMMKIIIETRPEMIDVRDHDGNTPLVYASRIGKLIQDQNESCSLPTFC